MTTADYFFIIVALWSYTYMIIHMHIYAFHMDLKAGHRHHIVTSTGTWSCMRGWHHPRLNFQMELHHDIHTFHVTWQIWNCRLWIFGVCGYWLTYQEVEYINYLYHQLSLVLFWLKTCQWTCVRYVYIHSRCLLSLSHPFILFQVINDEYWHEGDGISSTSCILVSSHKNYRIM